jgi:predicted phage terminase large subunit-like protein
LSGPAPAISGVDLARVLPAGFASLASRGRWTSAPHLTFLSLVLAAALARKVTRIMILMPPRHGKSMLVSQFFPAWWLGRRPNDRVILASYNDRFAAQWGRKARDTFFEYSNQVFGLRPRQGQTSTEDWGIAGHIGGMTTAGTGGSLTGRGADLLIIDDPFKDAAEAASERVRETTWEWWVATASTRLEPSGVAIVIQTRWHQDDLAGRLLKDMEEGGEQWMVVKMPAIAEEDEHWEYDGYIWTRKQGDPLWPARYNQESLEKIQRRSAYWWAALFQQRPAPPGGSIFKRPWFKVVKALPADRRVDVRCRFWDAGGSARTAKAKDPDYTVGTLVARVGNDYYVEHVARGQWSSAQVDAVIQQTARTDGWATLIREEREGGSSGIAVIESRKSKLAGFNYEGRPATGAKELRWQPFASQAEVGNVYVLESEWNRHWLDEFEAAPNGAHDDQIDSAVGAFMEVALGRPFVGSRQVQGY